jgi:uroporphyrinogen III methyltransferase/synthase
MAVPVSLTVTKIRTLTDSSVFVKTLARINTYDWIILTSPNGVETFFEAIAKLDKDARVFGPAKIAALGSRTAETLTRFGLKADYVPMAFTSKELAKGLMDFVNLKGSKILLMRSQLASEELPGLLQEGEAVVDDIPIYTHEKNLGDLKLVSEMLADKKVDWITFASPFAVTCFFEQIPAGFVKSSNARIASVGPVTSKRLAEFDVKVDVEPSEHTIDGMLSAIEASY